MKKSKGYLIYFVALVSLLVPAANAQAAIKVFTFQGVINHIEDYISAIDGSVANGTPFDGFCSYDTTTPDHDSDPNGGFYYSTSSLFGISLKVGNYVFRTVTNGVFYTISVGNNQQGDSLLFESDRNVCSKPLVAPYVNLTFSDGTGTPISNDSLPLAVPNVNAWNNGVTLQLGASCGDVYITGIITSVSDVPPQIPTRPSLSFGKALEIHWQTSWGYIYQVQRSMDLITWIDVGEAVIGDGGTLSQFVSTEADTRAFYRTEIMNFLH
jgi:hypothetical protein